MGPFSWDLATGPFFHGTWRPCERLWDPGDFPGDPEIIFMGSFPWYHFHKPSYKMKFFSVTIGDYAFSRRDQ